MLWVLRVLRDHMGRYGSWSVTRTAGSAGGCLPGRIWCIDCRTMTLRNHRQDARHLPALVRTQRRGTPVHVPVHHACVVHVVHGAT